ncbi:MAG: hypothetical protein R3C46_11875 [Hyphomonadaceae bacterium]
MPRSLFILFAAAVAALPASAQDQPMAEELKPERAMAIVIRNALAPESYGDWRYNWDAVSIRISSNLHWHLAGPDDPDADLITRRGWISAAGQQIAVMASGEGETVSALDFEVNSWRRGADEAADVLAALAAEGITATEVERRDAPEFSNTDEPVIVYRLSVPKRDAGNLTRSVSCTPPGSAAARRCGVFYSLALGG